ITEVNSGVFAFDAEILRDALSRLNTNNAQGELYLTDVLSIARADGHPVRAHTANDPAELAGVNDRVQLARAGEELNRRVLERTMRRSEERRVGKESRSRWAAYQNRKITIERISRLSCDSRQR